MGYTRFALQRRTVVFPCRIDSHEGLRREYEVLTLSIVVWHVAEYEHYRVAEESFGQFHEGDTYVVRWHYTISQVGKSQKS